MNTTLSTNIALLEQTHPMLVKLTGTLADAALDFRVTLDDWTIREILAHLVDDEMYVMRTRIERIIKEDHPELAPHDEKKWYANRNKTRDAIIHLLEDFLVQRAASLAMLKMLRPEDWQREGHQPEYGWFTAETWLGHWVKHDKDHLQQIEQILRTRQNATNL